VRVSMDIWNRDIGVFFLLLGSFIEMWAAAAICDILNEDISDCKDNPAWAVAVGVISLFLMIIVAILLKCKPDLVEGIFGQIIFILVFAIWVVGVAICTFESPFAPGPKGYQDYGYAGNGFFATWLCFGFSGILMVIAVPIIGNVFAKGFGSLDDARKYLLVIFTASVIEMWHAARVCDKAPYCTGMLAWGVAAGSVAAGLILIWALLLNFVPSVAGANKFFAVFLALWWTAAICSLTMPNDATNCDKDIFCRGLFLDVSNGFIGCWIAMGTAVFWAAAEFGLVAGAAGGGGDPEITSTESAGHAEGHTDSDIQKDTPADLASDTGRV